MFEKIGFPPSNYFAVGSSLDHECLSTCNVIDEAPCKTWPLPTIQTNAFTQMSLHVMHPMTSMIQTMKATSILMHARWMPLHVMHATIMTCMQHSCQACLSQSCHACRFHAMQTAAMTCMQQSCHAGKLQLASSQTCSHHSVLASWDLTMHASQAKRAQSLGKWLAVFWQAARPTKIFVLPCGQASTQGRQPYMQ